MEVPAGQGKSRIAAGIAYLILDTSDVHVYMVYPNTGLKNRDFKEQEDLFKVLHKIKPDTKKRLKYVVGVGSITKKEECVLIVDESDEIMFRNLRTFWKKIKEEDRSVICLTAAADDKYEGGVEEQALKTMGF